MKEEYQAIVQAGFLLQSDAPDLAMGKHVQFVEKTLEEFRTIIGLRIEALDHAVAGLPPGQVRHHLCWGNSEGPHHKDVVLKDIIDILLQARAGVLYVEGANPRHGHEWKVFRDVRLPEGMVVIAGTDCGFDTSVDRDRVAPPISSAKLKTMAEGAQLASKQLWG